MKKNIPTSKTTEWLLTRKCNMNCKYCFEKDKSVGTLNLDEFYNFLFKDNYAIPTGNFYMFGGEPMLELDLIIELIERIKADDTLCSDMKEEWIQSITKNLTTNGTLVAKNIDKLKKYNFSLQISLDGPKEINDEMRIDHAGNGKFEEIQKGIELLIENNIPFTLHGAVSGERFKYFDKITIWYIKEFIKRTPEINPNRLCSMLNNNYCQLLFEDDYTDEQIDELLTSYYNIVEYLLTSDDFKDFSIDERKLVVCGFLTRKGAICAAGNSMFAIDNNEFIYPCHRWMTSGLDKNHNLSFDGLKETRLGGTNYKCYEQLLDLPRSKIMYGMMYDNNIKSQSNFQFQANWCPATNLEVTGNAQVLPPKYTVMIAELQNFIPKLAEYFKIDIFDYMKNHKR